MSYTRHLDIAEKAVASLLIGLGLIHFAVFVGIMAPTSLWIDEIISIRDFSGQGLAASITRYPEPNNHIFYNALQSLILNGSDYDPVRARMLSILATLGGIVLMAHFLWRHGKTVEAGLAVLAIGASNFLLKELCQARGYGLQFFLLILLAVILWRDEESNSASRLWFGGLVVALLVWTAPSILLVLAPFGLLHIALSASRRRLFIMWSVAALISIGLYSPVLPSMLKAFTSFEEQHGALFNDWLTLGSISAHYFNEPFHAALFILLIISLAASLCIAKQKLRSPINWLAAFAIALALGWLSGNPPSRVYAPMAGVVWLSACFSLGTVTRQMKSPTARRITSVAAILLMFALLPGARQIGGYRYLPREDWQGVADFITTTYPPGTEIWCTSRGSLLELYLPASYPLITEVDKNRFHQGHQLLVDTRSSPSQPLPNIDYTGAFSAVIPQVRGDGQVIIFKPSPSLPTIALPESPEYVLKQADPKLTVYSLIHIGGVPFLEKCFILELDHTLTPAGDQLSHGDKLEILEIKRPILGLATPVNMQSETIHATYAQ